MEKARSSIAGAIGSIRRSIGGDLQGSQERAAGAKAPSGCPHTGAMDIKASDKTKANRGHQVEY